MTKKMTRVKYQKMKRNQNLRLRKWVIVVIFLIFLTTFLLSGSKMLGWFNDSKKSNKVKDTVLEKTKITEKKDTVDTLYVNYDEKQDSDYFRYIKMNLLEVNFNDLLNTNKDTVAWLNVSGTNINYPVVQTVDNSYYLSHAFDKTLNKAGWVFMDYRNNANTFDQNTIIYAHSRYDGTMFGSLKTILTSSWYKNKDNYIIRMSTPKENTMWQIFSTYIIPKESYYITPNFKNNDDYATFLKTIKERSEEEFSGTVNTNDKILTLSTCKDNFGNRVVMHAKLIKKEVR
mgnify:FL=1